MILHREVDAAAAVQLREMVARNEPHTWKTFYPIRDVARKFGFVAGEVILTDDQGSIIDHKLINVDRSIVDQLKSGSST